MLKPLVLSALFLFGFPTGANPLPMVQEPVPAPAPAPPPTTTRNPVTPTAETQARAKKIYGYDCEICHAANGNGKSDLAKSLPLVLSDWTDAKVLAAKTDGELYDTIKNGKDKMPTEGGRAKTDDIWNLVIYIRGMAKEPAASPVKPAE